MPFLYCSAKISVAYTTTSNSYVGQFAALINKDVSVGADAALIYKFRDSYRSSKLLTSAAKRRRRQITADSSQLRLSIRTGTDGVIMRTDPEEEARSLQVWDPLFLALLYIYIYVSLQSADRCKLQKPLTMVRQRLLSFQIILNFKIVASKQVTKSRRHANPSACRCTY